MPKSPNTPHTWLAATDYTAGDAFMREKASIFAVDWLPLCAVGQCREEGDFIAHTVGGWPLVAVRGAGGLRAFRNTCRHQNMLVVEQPAGNASVLQCRYHGWRYHLDGSFEGAPALVAPTDRDPASTSLHVIHTRDWQGVLFGSLAPVEPAFDAFAAIAGLDGNAEPLPHAGSFVTDLGCNWKLAIEQRLADGWSLRWPLLLARSEGDADRRSLVIEQVVPRSFLRTRIVSHVFAAADADTATASGRLAVSTMKAACEALQQRAAAGEARLVDAPAAHAFRACVAGRVG